MARTGVDGSGVDEGANKTHVTTELTNQLDAIQVSEGAQFVDVGIDLRALHAVGSGTAGE